MIKKLLKENAWYPVQFYVKFNLIHGIRNNIFKTNNKEVDDE